MTQVKLTLLNNDVIGVNDVMFREATLSSNGSFVRLKNGQEFEVQEDLDTIAAASGSLAKVTLIGGAEIVLNLSDSVANYELGSSTQLNFKNRKPYFVQEDIDTINAQLLSAGGGGGSAVLESLAYSSNTTVNNGLGGTSTPIVIALTNVVAGTYLIVSTVNVTPTADAFVQNTIEHNDVGSVSGFSKMVEDAVVTNQVKQIRQTWEVIIDTDRAGWSILQKVGALDAPAASAFLGVNYNFLSSYLEVYKYNAPS